MNFYTKKSIVKIIFKGIARWIIEIAIVIGIAYLIYYGYGEQASIIGESMETTLQNSDKILIDKITYHFTNPKRFDIIVFETDNKDIDNYYIKRVIGLPGETLQIIDKEIYIDEERLLEEIERELIINPGILTEPLTLEEDQYFVLGDNRNNSDDSRFPSIGIIQRDNIRGKAWLRIAPINNIAIIDKIKLYPNESTTEYEE